MLCEIRVYSDPNVILGATMEVGNNSAISVGKLTTLIREGPFGYSKTDTSTNFSTFSLNGPNALIKFKLLGFYNISYVILIGSNDSAYLNEGYGYYVNVYSSKTS